jgi:hypothetical protein
MHSSTDTIQQLDPNNFPLKKLGRRPIPEEKRRVQFGTRIERETLASLTKYAEANDIPLGRALDQIIKKSCAEA